MSILKIPASHFINATVPDAGVVHSWLGKTVLNSRILGVSTDETEAVIEFVDEPTDADRAFVVELCLHAGTSAMSADMEGRMRVSAEPRSTGIGRIVVTHNWADRTTWYTQSLRKTDHALTDSGDGLTFTSGIPYWIDLIHGKIYRENLIAHNYVEVIKVDGNPKLYGTDYTVDYITGSVTFSVVQTGAVTADFSHENGSLFIMSPSATAKRIWVEYSEVQFSEDVDINTTSHFQAWAYNPYDLPNKIAVVAPTSYYNLDNYIEEANGCYPVIPAMGGSRGITKSRCTFPFNYPVLKDIHACLGVEIRMWLEDDINFGGEYGTVTFYCTEYTDCKEHA